MLITTFVCLVNNLNSASDSTAQGLMSNFHPLTIPNETKQSNFETDIPYTCILFSNPKENDIVETNNLLESC